MRSGEGFDPGDIVDMDVEGAADRGYRLFVEIGAHAGLGAGVVGLVVRGDAAHEDIGRARAEALVGHARQVFYVVVEVFDVQLFDLRRAEGLHAGRDALQIFFAFLGGDDDLAQALILCRVGRAGRAGRRQHG